MRTQRRSLDSSHGFTLFETLIVTVIIAVLVGIALAKYFRSVERARSSEAVGNLASIRRGELLHQVKEGNFVEAVDLPAINKELDLELTARDFDYQVTQARKEHFLIVATSRHGTPEPLRATMNQAGKLTYYWPGETSATIRGDGGGAGGGGIGGGASGGDGGSTSWGSHRNTKEGNASC